MTTRIPFKVVPRPRGQRPAQYPSTKYTVLRAALAKTLRSKAIEVPTANQAERQAIINCLYHYYRRHTPHLRLRMRNVGHEVGALTLWLEPRTGGRS